MSPEQCRGAGGVYARSDVYALGVMLFDMFAGTPPFVGAGFGEIIAQHLFQEPPSLSKLAPDMPASVAALVMRLLAKDKALRPTMREVAAELLALSKKVADKPRLPDVIARRAGSTEARATTPSASEQVTHTRPSTGNLPRWGIAIAVFCIFGLGGWQWWSARPVAKKDGSAQATALADAPGKSAPAVLPWAIDSEPPGANVFRADDNMRLCETPCRLREAARGEPVRLRLERTGYADRTIVVDATRPVQRHEILDLVAPPSASSVRGGEPTRTSNPSGKSGRGAQASGSVSSSSGSVKAAAGSTPPKPPERIHVRPKIED